MMNWSKALPKKPGMYALLASGAVFLVTNALTPKPPSLFKVPMATRYVTQGQKLSSSDIRWVSSGRIHPAPARTLLGYARSNLWPGEILSPVAITHTVSTPLVALAVAPSDPADLAVAKTGGRVDILILSASGVVWKSGAVPVFGVNTTQERGTVEVGLSMSEALTFDERAAGAYKVRLLGIRS